MPEFTSPQDFANWSRDQQLPWLEAMAARAALRVLSIASRANSPGLDSLIYVLALMRAHLLMWGGLSNSTQETAGIQDSIARAASHLEAFSIRVGEQILTKSSYQTPPPMTYSRSKKVAAEKAAKDSTAYSLRALRSPPNSETVVNCLKAIDNAAAAIQLAFDVVCMEAQGRNWVYDGPKDVMGKHVGEHAEPSPEFSAERVADFWRAVSFDASWLEQNRGGTFAYSPLMHLPLWPENTLAASTWVSQLLTEFGSGIAWADEWYMRRLEGCDTAFNIPCDDERAENQSIFMRLAQAPDQEFWNRGRDFAVSEIQRWIDEARNQNPSPAVIESNSTSGALEVVLPNQNPNALEFERSHGGKIALAAKAGLNELQTDRDARDRHGGAVQQAVELLQSCQGSNVAHRLAGLIDNYLAAAGGSIEEMRPSLFVQRGERLRQELAAYEATDSTMPPLRDDLKLDLASLCRSHNMIIELDPALAARDRAMLSPDLKPHAIPPREIAEFVRAADASGLLENGVAEVVIEAAGLAPSVPNERDRRSLWSAETVGNLVIELFALALNKPIHASVLGVSSAFVLSLGWPGGATTAFSCALFLVGKRSWIEGRLVRNAPTWAALFAWLCDRIEKHSPLGSNSSDKSAR